jgi:hypothetical protein
VVNGPHSTWMGRSRKNVPDRLIVIMPGLQTSDAKSLADYALKIAVVRSPKMTGISSKQLKAIYGPNFYGIQWFEDYVWYQESGTKPFTMFALAGKVIPMWISDPTGFERKKNPKARTRTTASGTVQVLIFRRAAKPGQRKTTRRRVGGQWVSVSVPMSYPGAPGRIALRGAAGQILSPSSNRHIGVRWRNPGLGARQFLHYSLIDSAKSVNLDGAITSIKPLHGSPVGGIR